VTPGQTIEVERLEADQGKTIELDRVMLLGDGDKVTIGEPTVEGAKVIAPRRGKAKARKSSSSSTSPRSATAARPVTARCIPRWSSIQ
jgi:ribosomal protein L21